MFTKGATVATKALVYKPGNTAGKFGDQVQCVKLNALFRAACEHEVM